MRFLIINILSLIIPGRLLYAQQRADTAKMHKVPLAYNYTAANPNFPFILSLTSIEYDVTINLRDKKIKDIYAPIFKNNNLPFNSESWELIVTRLFEKDSIMHHQITTSAENEVLRIGTGGAGYQKAFIQYMLPIFSDTAKLSSFLSEEED